ncbi:13267_t:CDS:2 [Entrophospora sp. SA101]|nr:13267_t:CDS:2 [Entrophospora sp. SA101]
MSTTPIKYKSAKSKTKSGRVVKRSSKIKNKRDDDITIANNGGGSGSSSQEFINKNDNETKCEGGGEGRGEDDTSQIKIIKNCSKCRESNKFVKLLNNRLSKIEDLIANLNQTINNNNNNKFRAITNSCFSDNNKSE